MLVNLFCLIASLSVVECRNRYYDVNRYKAHLRGDSRSPRNAMHKVEKTRNFSVEDINSMNAKVCDNKMCHICLTQYKTIIEVSHRHICEIIMNSCCSGPSLRTRY